MEYRDVVMWRKINSCTSTSKFGTLYSVTTLVLFHVKLWCYAKPAK